MSVLDANIFGKYLFDVTTEDVREFCREETREGVNLDYKSKISSSLAKTIAAMANTLGGWIIIGINDEDDKPKPPFEGINYEESLPLRINNLVIDKISPPLLPIIHVCDPDEKGKTFVVIYVNESPEAPHWLFNQNKLPIRLQDRTSSSKWHRLASSSEWEYLRNKREKSVKLRKSIKNELTGLFLSYDHKSISEYQQSRTEPNANVTLVMPEDADTYQKINITVSPKYPYKQLFKVTDGVDIVKSLRFTDSFSSEYFPKFANEFEIFQNGVHKYAAREDRSYVYFMALEKHGMISFKEKIISYEEDSPHVNLEQSIVRFKQLLHLSRQLYSKLYYYGTIQIEFILHGDEWMKLQMSEAAHFTQELLSPQAKITFSRESMLTQLTNEEHLDELVHALYTNIANSFRWEPSRRRNLNSILSSFPIGSS